MEDFWNIIRGWEPLGQGVFFLIIFGGIFALIRFAIFYIGVLFRGWPPEHIRHPDDDDD